MVKIPAIDESAHEAASTARPAIEQIWTWLGEVADPEIPVVSVVDLGIVRRVAWSEDGVCVVTVTPTYSGCPATAVIQSQIQRELRKRGIARVDLRIQLSPPWTSDWLSPQARENLRAYGIAPPQANAPAQNPLVWPASACSEQQPAPACPRCGSARTMLLSQFGSTLCKALFRCQDCLEPFDYFKCH